MATTLTVQTTSRAGLSQAAHGTAADATGNNWKSNANEILRVFNGGGASITATLVFGPDAAVDGQMPTNKTVSIAAGDTVDIGPFPAYYQDATDKVNITWTGTMTSVKVMVLKLGS